MDLRTRFHAEVPVALRANASFRIVLSTVADHASKSLFPLHICKKHLVGGDFVLSEVEALDLICELVDWKLSLFEQMLPGKSQQSEQVFSEDTFLIGQ